MARIHSSFSDTDKCTYREGGTARAQSKTGGGRAIQAQRAKAPGERLPFGAAEFVDGNF